MDEWCCRSVSDGASSCAVSASAQKCKGAGTSPSDEQVSASLHTEIAKNISQKQAQTPWRTIHSGFLFVVACITSPCCTPLIVPGVFALLAGTPAAIWLAQYLGWIYAGLTVISVLSLVFWLRSLGQQRLSRPLSLLSFLSTSNRGKVEISDKQEPS